jgi:membrane peptidoglycan carboxypeptidase
MRGLILSNSYLPVLGGLQTVTHLLAKYLLARGHEVLEELPPRVVAATLVLEDRRFWSHPGIDPVAMTRALWQNFRGGRRVSGAS